MLLSVIGLRNMFRKIYIDYSKALLYRPVDISLYNISLRSTSVQGSPASCSSGAREYSPTMYCASRSRQYVGQAKRLVAEDHGVSPVRAVLPCNVVCTQLAPSKASYVKMVILRCKHLVLERLRKILSQDRQRSHLVLIPERGSLPFANHVVHSLPV